MTENFERFMDIINDLKGLRHRSIMKELTELNDEVKSDKWKCLCFSKDGKSDLSSASWSKEDAEKYAAEGEIKIKSKGWVWICDDGTWFMGIPVSISKSMQAYSHIIVVPWKEKT